jgi:hypothetical protein
MTAWHCCLECYSTATRLPAEYRLSAAEAVLLLTEEVFARMTVHDLPAKDRIAMLRAAAKDNIGGGRVYDSHIADVARAAGATVVITDSRRHFVSACAASTTFAGERQLFLPAKGQQMSVDHHRAALGYGRPVGGLIRQGQRRSADRRGGAQRSSGHTAVGSTQSYRWCPDHRAAAVTAAVWPRRFVRSVR